MKRKRKIGFYLNKNERGSSILAIIVLTAISIALTMGILTNVSSSVKIKAITDDRSDNYYEAEQAISQVATWLRSNGDNFISAFSEDNFNNNFQIGTPFTGVNDSGQFSIPTQVKLKGSGGDKSILLTNDASFGTTAFPTTTSLTGSSFNAINSFQTAFAKPSNIRINVRAILLWAEKSGEHYVPIFRVDAATGNNPDRGVHLYSIVTGSLETEDVSAAPVVNNFGFYGKNSFTTSSPNPVCSSYSFIKSSGVWVLSAAKNNCVVGSNSTISLMSPIYGHAFTNASNAIVLQNPSGAVSGTKCSNSGCHTYSLPNYSPWSTYLASACGGSAANVTISSNTTWDTPVCRDTVTISANRTLTLRGTSSPYYIRNFVFLGNNAKVELGNIGDDDSVTIFTENFDSHQINGNRLVNAQYRPRQLIINYIAAAGTTLRFNGTAEMRAVVTAPYSDALLLGNFNYYGSIKANTFNASGNARFNYDEDIALIDGTERTETDITGVTFRIAKISQRYR